ncbi:MAG: hypothetical protein KBS64_04320 [Treponema sp.]|nr:hypothetical protein [Candidatus Treponema equi]
MAENIRKALVLVFMLAGSTAFAKTGVGIQGGIKFSPEADVCSGLVLRSDHSPWGLAASWNIEEKSLDLVLDNWVFYKKINAAASWFALWGMSYSGRFENECFIETGARLGVGANVFFFDSRSLEFYAQTAWNPSVGMYYDRDEKECSLRFVPACFPINAGIRFWF